MSDNGSGLLKNLFLIYESYGWIRSFIASGYTWMSVVFTCLAWRKAIEGNWADTALAILPTLAGFSIAAYAVYFSVLSDKERTALLAPDETLGGRSPLLILASSVSHTVFIQVIAILLAIVFQSKPFPTLEGFEKWAKIINNSISFGGLFLTVYGITLVLAAVFSIFRILHIKTRIVK
ncbi:hypothetical protein [Rhizobium sp.]|jgi:hypothetical protein|uniref:hypothetical protein n=1 Tax=Rhizobium sp. TaxID=391 RepID=UPI000E8C358E|nr:hypothetical protein [Rhizobium sp.]